MASNKITKKDLNEMAVRSMAEQCCFSFERMQAVGFCYGMTKCFPVSYTHLTLPTKQRV